MVNALFAGTLTDTFTGAIGEPSMEFFRSATPRMLARLSACGPSVDPRLAYLANIRLEPEGGDRE